MAKLLENQTKEILQKRGVNIPIGMVASTPQEATTAVEKIGGQCVVKALVPMGKKGKAGLIKTVTRLRVRRPNHQSDHWNRSARLYG